MVSNTELGAACQPAGLDAEPLLTAKRAIPSTCLAKKRQQPIFSREPCQVSPPASPTHDQRARPLSSQSRLVTVLRYHLVLDSALVSSERSPIAPNNSLSVQPVVNMQAQLQRTNLLGAPARPSHTAFSTGQVVQRPQQRRVVVRAQADGKGYFYSPTRCPL